MRGFQHFGPPLGYRLYDPKPYTLDLYNIQGYQNGALILGTTQIGSTGGSWPAYPKSVTLVFGV